MACDYLSMLGLKLNHVSKRGHRGRFAETNTTGVVGLHISCYARQFINDSQLRSRSLVVISGTTICMASTSVYNSIFL